MNLAGRVVEALPNGVLVVEAVRDLTVGNDRQTIVLRGLVRPGDIASDGSVLSSSIANLEAEIHGKGVVADAIHQPNIVDPHSAEDSRVLRGFMSFQRRFLLFRIVCPRDRGCPARGPMK